MKPRKDGRYVKKKVINGKAVFFYSDEKTERAAQKDIDRQMLAYVTKIEAAAKFRVVAAEWEADHIEKISHRTWCGYAAHYKRVVQHFGDQGVDKIAPADIQRYIANFSSYGYAHKTVITIAANT